MDTPQLGLRLLLYPIQFVCFSHGQCYLKDDSRYGQFFVVWSEHRISTLIQCALSVDKNLDHHQLMKADGICTVEPTRTRLLQEICKRKSDCKKSTCRDYPCWCPIGYSFDYELKVCRNLRGCRSLLSSFVEHKKKKLTSKMILRRGPPVSKEDCKRRCLESKAACRALVAKASLELCILFRASTRPRNAGLAFGVIYYERQCDWKK